MLPHPKTLDPKDYDDDRAAAVFRLFEAHKPLRKQHIWTNYRGGTRRLGQAYILA